MAIFSSVSVSPRNVCRVSGGRSHQASITPEVQVSRVADVRVVEALIMPVLYWCRGESL